MTGRKYLGRVRPEMKAPEPPSQMNVLEFSIGLIGLGAAGGLVGFSIVLWIAANWQVIDKFTKFAVVGTIILITAIASVACPRGRSAATLLGMLALGSLFALYGQVYQVSNDSYVLFAMWSAIALPWAGAARSDAVWSLWVLITFTALTLWDGPAGRAPEMPYISWAIAIAIAGLLSPWRSLLSRFLVFEWAYRLAAVLTLGLITGDVLMVVAGSLSSPVVLTGFIALGVAIGLFALAQPFSFSHLVLATLALDIVLLYLIARVFPIESVSDSSFFLILGLIYAGVIGGSAVAVMKVAKWREAKGFSQAISNLDLGSHWAVALMSGVGALTSLVPIVIFIVIAFGENVFLGATTYMVGGVAIAAAALVLHGSSSVSFRQQFGFFALVIGLSLVIYAVYRDVSESAACIIVFVICVGLASWAPSRWMITLFGVGAGAVATWFFRLQFALKDLERYNKPTGVFGDGLAMGLLISAGVAALGLASMVKFFSRQDSKVSARAQRAEGFVTGWCGLILVAGVLLTPSFLISGNWHSAPHMMQSLTPDFNVTAIRILAIAIIVTSIASLMLYSNGWPDIAAWALAAVMLVLGYVMPILAVPIVILAAATNAGRRRLALFAVVTVVWLIGAFYYWLGWPLEMKAYLLGALGVGLGVLTLLCQTDFNVSAPGVMRMSTVMPMWPAGILTALSLGAATVTTAIGIQEKEAILKDGRRILVRLAPVDPRSLMRGDYMALNFEQPRLAIWSSQGDEMPMWAVAEVDTRGVAKIRSFAWRGTPHITNDLLLLKVRVLEGQMVLGTNAYFFEEGTSKKYQYAQYGVFRVGPRGDMILVGLANKDLELIK